MSNPAPATPPATDPAPAAPTAPAPAAGVPPATEPAQGTPPAAAPAPAAEPAAPENLLADPAPAAPGADAPAPAPGQAPEGEPTAEAVAAVAAAIKPADLGKGIDGQPLSWDTEAVDRVARVFARRGVSSEVANEIVQAYAEHFRAKSAAAVEADASLNKTMVAECRQKFGADMPRYIEQARKGGADIFGKELFAQLCSVPAFANDHRIISALAARGRAVTDDPGPGGPGGRAPAADLAQGMYGGDALSHIK